MAGTELSSYLSQLMSEVFADDVNNKCVCAYVYMCNTQCKQLSEISAGAPRVISGAPSFSILLNVNKVPSLPLHHQCTQCSICLGAGGWGFPKFTLMPLHRKNSQNESKLHWCSHSGFPTNRVLSALMFAS